MWCDTHKCDAPLFSGYRQTCPQSAGFESHVPAEKLADPPQVESLAVPVLASFETPHDQYTSSWWAVESNQWSLSLNQVETAQQGYCNTYMKENISGVTYKHYSKLFYLSSVWVQWTNSFQVHYLLGTVVQIRTWLLIVYIIQQCNNTVSNFSSITINLQQSIIMWPACWSQSLLSIGTLWSHSTNALNQVHIFKTLPFPSVKNLVLDLHSHKDVWTCLWTLIDYKAIPN